MRVFDFGPRAGEIPGPEDIEDFDPTQHLIIDNKAIATVPGHPGILLRWHPRSPSMQGFIPTTGEAIEHHITRAQQHLQAIRTESGGLLEVPSHRSFVASHPRKSEQLAIITTVERIEGVSYGATTRAPETATALYGLAHYLRWVVTTQQPEILSDTFSSKQLVTAGHQNYVVDTDAILSSTPKEPVLMQYYVDRLRKWRERLPDTPYAVATDNVLHRVEQTIHGLSSVDTDESTALASNDHMLPAMQQMLQTMSPDSTANSDLNKYRT
jgi:hypothetical protein